MLSRSCWPRSNCIQHYQGQLNPLMWQRPSWFKGSTQLVVRYWETKTENLVRSLKFQFQGLNFSSESWNQSWRETLEVSISSFEFLFPGFREHSYPVFQTSAQSFEVKGTHEPFWLQNYVLEMPPLYLRTSFWNSKSRNLNKDHCSTTLSNKHILEYNIISPLLKRLEESCVVLENRSWAL